MKKGWLFILFFPMLMYAQQKQPKIGLVLSGGGAKGIAHIGILKEIDRAGLQIDYIGGTSMGAILGGLYATGYSGVQIEQLIDSLDMVGILQDERPRSALPYYEKEFSQKHAISLPVSKKGIQLPAGVSKGQSILDLLNYILSPVDSIKDFSKLPIPFFCVATDVVNGELVLLEKGSLPLAIAASGSFPTLLSPVEMQGKLLIDGGIANNFPSDIMKAKGVDIIIGIDVQSDLIKREELNSVINILNQIVSYDIYEQSKKGRQSSDIYIKPDIDRFSVVDFEKSEEILMVGNQAGERYRHAIDSLAALQESAHYRKPLVLNDVPVKIESIQIFGAKNYTTAYVKGKLKIRLGDEISRFELTKRMEYLAATENYNQIDYQLEKGELRIFLIEEEQKAHLKIGAHFDDLYQSAVLVTLDHKRLLIDNDELSVDFILGDRVRFNLNYFVDNGFYTSFGLKARYNHFRTNTSFSFDNSNANNTDLNYQDVTTELFAQTTFNRRFAVGLGAEWKHLRVTTENFNDQESFQRLTLDDSDYLSLNAFAKLDTYDDAWFPTRGVFADVGGKWYAWSSDYLDNFQPFIQIGGTIGFATTFWDRWTFQYTNDAGFTFGNPQSEVFDFYMGGYNQNYINTFVPLYGYEFAQVFNESFLRSEFLFRYRLAKNNYAVFIANYGRVAENVFVNTKDLFKDVLSGYALGYSLNTLIGPIEIKYSWSPENTKGAWLFNLGFWF